MNYFEKHLVRFLLIIFGFRNVDDILSTIHGFPCDFGFLKCSSLNQRIFILAIIGGSGEGLRLISGLFGALMEELVLIL